METEKLFQSLTEKRFNRAFPEAKTKVNVMINNSRMYITIVCGMLLNRNDTSRILHPLFKKERFKNYEKHVRITCIGEQV